jgi:hypothetical protein
MESDITERMFNSIQEYKERNDGKKPKTITLHPEDYKKLVGENDYLISNKYGVTVQRFYGVLLVLDMYVATDKWELN